MSACAAWAPDRGEVTTSQPVCVEKGGICDEAGFFDASSQQARLRGSAPRTPSRINSRSESGCETPPWAKAACFRLETDPKVAGVRTVYDERSRSL
jgi:hypothetical protein